MSDARRYCKKPLPSRKLRRCPAMGRGKPGMTRRIKGYQSSGWKLNPPKKKMTNPGFFAIGRKTFIKACNLGLNAACTLLVMAHGTGKDNVTTRWSAKSVHKCIGVRWNTADEAIKLLLKNELVTIKPAKILIYKLEKDGDLIWLPNTLISGAGNEIPPITKVRQTQDVMILRLLIELYSAQNLREDGGIRLDIYRQNYTRRKVGEQGAYTVWDFTVLNGSIHWNDVTRPHERKIITAEDRAAGEHEVTDFYRRFACLKSMGLVEWVPYLFEGEGGEPIHPFVFDKLPIEQALYIAATKAAIQMMTPQQLDSIKGDTVPVYSHIAKVEMFGMARLTYRPQTRLTAAWWAEHHNKCQAFIEKYEALATPATGEKT